MPPRRKDGSPPREKRRKRLTEFDVRRTKPEESAFQIWDEDVKGFHVRIQPTGQRSFFTYYRRNGRRRYYHIGDVREVDLGDARRIAAKIKLKVIEGEDPVADRRAQRDQGTLEQVHRRYVEQHARRKNKSWRRVASLITRFALPYLGERPIKGITRTDIRTTIARVDKPVLANAVLANLSAVFSWAAREDLIDSNPCKGITYNPVTSRERILSDDELPRVWAALGDSVQALTLKTVLLTGQRPGEVSNMRREHVVGGWWQMPGAPDPKVGWPGTKNGKNHRVWLPSSVMEIIGEGAAGFVFTGKDGRAVRKVDELMRSVCRKIGVERATPHDLRRTFLSKVTGLKFGRHLMDVIANHKSDEVTDVYDRHDYGPEIQRAMEAVSAHITDLVEGRRPGNVVPLVR